MSKEWKWLSCAERGRPSSDSRLSFIWSATEKKKRLHCNATSIPWTIKCSGINRHSLTHRISRATKRTCFPILSRTTWLALRKAGSSRWPAQSPLKWLVSVSDRVRLCARKQRPWKPEAPFRRSRAGPGKEGMEVCAGLGRSQPAHGRGHPLKDAVPVAQLGLPKQAHGWIPRTVLAIQQPSPVRCNAEG